MSGESLNPKEHTSDDYKVYSSVPSDVDLIEDRPGFAVDKERRLPRMFKARTAGNIVLTPLHEAADVTLPVAADDPEIITAKTLKSSGTTALPLKVYW